MNQTHAGRPATERSGERATRPTTQMPAGPDYWPVPARAVARPRVEKLTAARERTRRPAS